jgi:hypothetical protein
MARKKKQTEPILKQYQLPSEDNDLKKFIDVKKVDMMEQTVSSIEFALDNNLPIVEIFQFHNSEFVVMLSDKDFLPNLEHIYDYYIQNEMYEFCSRVVDLKKRLGTTVKLNET